ncbi:hypothetical protein B0H14DRAFT_2625957 [Mycena olivaceomarginata]|nr:hypothetical protein B0H14DRAFT_2625957 [Mycena olivaceomarginata]
MADIQSRATKIPALASVTVAPLSFQRAIISISTQARPRDSFGKKSAGSQFTPHLAKWLKSSFHATFMNLGDMLPHPHQGDFVHCGIYAANTLEHTLFQTPLISYADCRTVRMAWFKIFASKGSSGTHATPLLANHNFPDLGPVNLFGEEISSPAAAAPPTMSSVPSTAKDASRPVNSVNPTLIKLGCPVDPPPRSSVAPSKMTAANKRKVADHSSSDESDESDSYR